MRVALLTELLESVFEQVTLVLTHESKCSFIDGTVTPSRGFIDCSNKDAQMIL